MRNGLGLGPVSQLAHGDYEQAIVENYLDITVLGCILLHSNDQDRHVQQERDGLNGGGSLTSWPNSREMTLNVLFHVTHKVMIVQQPDGDDSPGIGDIPEHVVVDRVGTGTVISGLRPGAVAAEGVVASLKFGVATVLEGASIGAALPTKELVSVVSVLLAREAASVVVVDGAHSPAIVDMPNGDVIGSVATGGVKLTEGLGVTEERDEDATPPLVIAVLLPLAVVELVVPVMGHATIPPSELPGIGPKLPV